MIKYKLSSYRDTSESVDKFNGGYRLGVLKLEYVMGVILHFVEEGKYGNLYELKEWIYSELGIDFISKLKCEYVADAKGNLLVDGGGEDTKKYIEFKLRLDGVQKFVSFVVDVNKGIFQSMEYMYWDAGGINIV